MLKKEIKKDKLRILLTETLAETENPEGGDIGDIFWPQGNLKFTRVFRTQNGDIWHEGILNGNRPNPNTPCSIEIDSYNRLHNSAYHSFSHLITGIARRLLKKDFIGTSKKFSDYGILTLKAQKDALPAASEIWQSALEYINKPAPIERLVLSKEKALSIAGTFFQSVIPANASEIRLIKVGHDLAWIPCRGVHLRDLGQISSVENSPKLSAWTEDEDLCFNYHLTFHQ